MVNATLEMIRPAFTVIHVTIGLKYHFGVGVCNACSDERGKCEVLEVGQVDVLSLR